MSTHDGHEGWVAMLFADGATGSGSASGLITVSTLGDGTRLPYDQWQSRPGADVVGWVVTCECGWRGRPWQRTLDPNGDSIDARVGYTDDPTYAEPHEWLESLLHDEWLHGHEMALSRPLLEAAADQHRAIRASLRTTMELLQRAEDDTWGATMSTERSAAYRAARAHLQDALRLVDALDVETTFDLS